MQSPPASALDISVSPPTHNVYVDDCAGVPYTLQATTTIAPLDADCFEVLFQYF